MRLREIANRQHRPWLLALALAIGVLARIVVSTWGHNYDIESYLIVAKIIKSGGNIYAETTRYNYGPAWCYVVAIVDAVVGRLPLDHVLAFHVAISSLLSAADVGIALILYGQFGLLASVLFILNPVSIVISGYHSQFGNVAILLGLIAVRCLRGRSGPTTGWNEIGGLVLLGLSLVTKHILFAFPLWLAFGTRGIRKRIMMLVIPISVFAASLLPFWFGGSKGIVQNILLYHSWQNEILYGLLVPDAAKTVFSSNMLWVVCLIGFGYGFRNEGETERLLLYSSVLVWSSPAIANQYLAIPVAFVAANMNIPHALYTLLGGYFLAVDQYGLHLPWPLFGAQIERNTAYAVLILCLLLGFLWASLGPRLTMRVKGSLLRSDRL